MIALTHGKPANIGSRLEVEVALKSSLIALLEVEDISTTIQRI